MRDRQAGRQTKNSNEWYPKHQPIFRIRWWLVIASRDDELINPIVHIVILLYKTNMSAHLFLWTVVVVLGVFINLLPTAAFVVVPQRPSPLVRHSSRRDDHDSNTNQKIDADPSFDTMRRSLVVMATTVGTPWWQHPPCARAAPKKDLAEDYRQGTAALNDANTEMAPVPREAYVQLPSGVIYADVVRPVTGSSGDVVVRVGSKVNIQWVLRRSNGYFVDSSQVHDSVPFVFTVGDTTAIRGLDEGIRGMPVGGVRRLLIPPSLAYVQGVEDGRPGPIPVGYGPRQQIRRIQNIRKDVPGEYIYLEIQLTRLR